MFTIISKGAGLNPSGLHNFLPSFISFCSQFKAETKKKYYLHDKLLGAQTALLLQLLVGVSI